MEALAAEYDREKREAWDLPGEDGSARGQAFEDAARMLREALAADLLCDGCGHPRHRAGACGHGWDGFPTTTTPHGMREISPGSGCECDR